MVPILLREYVLPKSAVLKKAIPVVTPGYAEDVNDGGAVDIDSTSAAVERQIIPEHCLFCGDANFGTCGNCHKYRKGN